MTVRQWIEFLMNDVETVNIGMQTEGYRGRVWYFSKEECLKEFDGWLEDKVTKIYHKNFENNTLLIIEPTPAPW